MSQSWFWSDSPTHRWWSVENDTEGGQANEAAYLACPL